MKKVSYDTISIHHEYYCKDCGWPVITACCNGSFQKFKDADEWDWWIYCSNKGCKNHDGEGTFQNKISWLGLGCSYNKIMSKKLRSKCPQCNRELVTSFGDLSLGITCYYLTCYGCNNKYPHNYNDLLDNNLRHLSELKRLLCKDDIHSALKFLREFFDGDNFEGVEPSYPA